MATLPYIVFSDTIPVVEVTTGRLHTCALFENGKARCWGDTQYKAVGYAVGGNVGDAPNEMETLVYLPFPGHLPDIVSIDAGHYHSCAIFANAEVYCWGEGNHGRTGQETTLDLSISQLSGPVKIHPNLTEAGVTAMADVCGDGVIDPAAYPSENCDDGNTVSGDGCSAECSIEPFASCPTPGEPCTVTDPVDASLYCSRLLTGDPGNVDGNYTVGPIGERGAVWCERETSAAGGAWTNVLSKGTGGGADFYTSAATAIGDASSPAPESVPGWRKLADRAINLAQLGAWPQQAEPLVVVRLRGSLDPNGMSWDIRGRLGLYVDTRKGFGLVPRSKTFEACRALDLAACDSVWATYTSSVGTIDTVMWRPPATGDDTTRMLLDHFSFPGPRCDQAGTDGDRCLSAGGGGATHTLARVDVMALGAVCGDGVVDPVLETCDDGGVLGGDG
jgi:cysteine-rich repeat protein